MSILGDTRTDPNKILPLTYPWARSYYQAGVANNWVPEEVGMQKDVEQWKSSHVLDEYERRLILWNLGFFSTAESLTANNIVLAIYERVTNPECRQYLLRQAFEEAVHTDTFIYCCDTLGLDPEDIYTMYKRVPSISEKDDLCIEMTRTLSADSRRRPDVPVQDLLYDLIGYYVVMEGIFFYAGFAMMLALKRQGKMLGVGEQFEFIMRDECLTSDHELLTPAGWKPITSITTQDRVAQWHKDGSIDFAYPVHLSKSKASHTWTIENQQGHFSQRVSPRHRIPVFLKKSGTLVDKAPDTVSLSAYCSIPCAGEKKGGRGCMIAYERFLVALQADGSMPSARHTGKHSGAVPVTFQLSRVRKIERLRDILSDANLKHTECPASRGRITFRVSVPWDIPLPLSKNFEDWVNLEDVNVEWLRQFLDEVVQWDGSRRSRSLMCYVNRREESVKIVQAAAVLAGYRTHVGRTRKDGYEDCFRLSWRIGNDKMDTQRLQRTRNDSPEMVYGVEVPSTYLVVRRKEAVSVTGNSVHLAFGCELINTIKTEHPNAWDEEFRGKVVDLIDQAVDLECQYARDACPRGLLGINAEQFARYVRFVADRRLERIGLPTRYHEDNPFPWMAQASDLGKEKNFFETTVSEYQSAGSLTVV